MAHLRNLPEDAVLRDVVTAFPEPLMRLRPYADALMRGPSPLTPGDRELIAAYVSGLNGCGFCQGVHSATAAAFGVPETLLGALLAGVDGAPVAPRLKPLLNYVRKLTQTPSRMVHADADAVYAAGWDDTALMHAVAVCAYFNMMNRLVEGIGVKGDAAYHREAGQRLARDGYLTQSNSAPDSPARN